MSEPLSLRTASEQLERVLQVLDAHSDPEVCRVARTAVSLLVELYGTGLARTVELARDHGADGLVDRLGEDPLVGPLLAVSGDHPHGVQRRIEHALDEVRAALDVEGCQMNVGALDGSKLRIGLTHGPRACSSTIASVRRAIEVAVLDRVPELTEINFDDQAVQTSAVIPLANLRGGGMALAGAEPEVRA